MNGTEDTYRMNPREDTVLRSDQLAEGMWVLAEDAGLRVPLADSGDDQIRAQRFRQVTALPSKAASPAGRTPGLIAFTGTWADGYQRTHTAIADMRWIVKKALAPAGVAVSATVSKGDVIRIIPKKGPERVMKVAHVEHYVITLADLPAEGEG